MASEWAATQSLRGVSEGDMTRYALARREPLLVELETFAAYVAATPSAGVVTLAEGLRRSLVRRGRAGERARPARRWSWRRRAP